MEKTNTQNTNSSTKVKLMCSYGGKIQLRPNTHHLTYVGGDTKLLTVERNAKFSEIVTKISTLFNINSSEFRIKYQLPGEDLDALVSMIDDDDAEHMMFEYNRLLKDPNRSARIRLFLFVNKQLDLSPGSNAPLNPDFLFGFDKDYVPSSVPVPKVEENNQNLPTSEGTGTPPPALDLLQIPGMVVPGFSGSDYGTSNHAVGTRNYNEVGVGVHGAPESHVINGPYVYRVPLMAGGAHAGYYAVPGMGPGIVNWEQPVYNFVPAMPSFPEQKMMVSMGVGDQLSHEIKVNQRNV